MDLVVHDLVVHNNGEKQYNIIVHNRPKSAQL